MRFFIKYTMSFIVSQKRRKLYFAGVTDSQFLGKMWRWKVDLFTVGKAV
jgi:hypothetical protein